MEIDSGTQDCSIQIVLGKNVAIHMRLAAVLAKFASQFESELILEHEEASANCKSLLGIIMLGISEGARFTIIARGDDAQKAVEQLRLFFKNITNERNSQDKIACRENDGSSMKNERMAT